MTAWGELVRTVGRLGRALLRFLAGARRGTRSVPVHVVPGPPPHWVERVRQGAPGLLEPPPRAQVEAAPKRTPPLGRPVGARRVATVAHVQRSLRRLQRSLPRPASPRLAETVSHPPPPAAVDAPASPIVRRDPPPGHEPPPAAAASERAGPGDRPAASPIPARPPIGAALPRRVPAANAVPTPDADVSWEQSLAATPPGAARSWDSPRRPGVRFSRTAPPVRVVQSPLAQPRPRAEPAVAARQLAEVPAPPELVRSELASVHTLVTRAEAAPAPRHDPWPELPRPVEQHDVDTDASLRALERAQRLDREQAGL